MGSAGVGENRQRHWLQPSRREVLLVAACSVVLLWQLFLPGFIGLADNRDFAKVTGRLCIGRVDEPTSYFEYFQPNYERGQRYCWQSGIPTSELALAWTASSVERRLGDPNSFDIRWLGAIHTLCFLAGWYTLLVALRPLPGAAWWIATATALWIFTDVSFVAYLNSFYTDAAAIVGAMIMLPAALLLLSADVPQNGPVVWFGFGALLFLTSKGQHAPLAPVIVVFLLAARWRASTEMRAGALTIGVAAILIAGSCWAIVQTPYWYKAQGRFNLVFFKVLPASPTPAADLAELGLSQSDFPYIGQYAFLPSSPAFDQVWLQAFSQRGSYGKVALFWLRHPWRMLATLRRDLETEAWQRRPIAFSNWQPEAGRPARSQTNRFGSWSALRTRLLHRWPMHIGAWCGLVLLFGPVLAARAGPGLLREAAWAAVFAATLAVGEFCFASLVDAWETNRHLLLFHFATDFTMLLSLIYGLAIAAPAHAGQPPACSYSAKES